MPDVPEKIVTLGKIWGGIRGMPLSKVFATNNNRFQGGGKGKMAGEKRPAGIPIRVIRHADLKDSGPRFSAFVFYVLLEAKKTESWKCL